MLGLDLMLFTASRHDSTEEIGAAIAGRLTHDGVDVERHPAGEAELPAAGVPIVLGSAIYFGRWLPAARRVATQLASEPTRRPLWLFSVGRLGNPLEPENPKLMDDLAPVLARARSHRVFAGRLDRSRLGIRERIVTRMVRAAEGDFRDWDEIDDWACEIASALQPAIRLGAGQATPRSRTPTA